MCPPEAASTEPTQDKAQEKAEDKHIITYFNKFLQKRFAFFYIKEGFRGQFFNLKEIVFFSKNRN